MHQESRREKEILSVLRIAIADALKKPVMSLTKKDDRDEYSGTLEGGKDGTHFTVKDVSYNSVDGIVHFKIIMLFEIKIPKEHSHPVSPEAKQ